MTTLDPGTPSPAAQEDEERLTRVDLFKSAYRLVSDHEWPDGFGVYDVINVARFLDGESV
ncbi:hypothetical protein ACFUGD_01315 [Streptomyces sp. NPDC057217]|uniref:hypothetical protein n=1 Tax=Streptomyces sp. NPDC057217 TaxID=3346054 RepID=UPI00362692E4